MKAVSPVPVLRDIFVGKGQQRIFFFAIKLRAEGRASFLAFHFGAVGVQNSGNKRSTVMFIASCVQYHSTPEPGVFRRK